MPIHHQQQLKKAINVGDHVTVQRLMHQLDAVDINAEPESTWFPLRLAVHDRRITIMQTLMQHPHIDINRKSSDGWSALHQAAIEKKPDAAAVLLASKQLDVNLPSGEYKRTALHLAAKHNCAAIVRALLQHPAIDVNNVDTTGKTALVIAIELEHNEIVQLLSHFDSTETKQEGDNTSGSSWPVSSGATESNDQVIQGVENLVFQGGGVRGIAYIGALNYLFSGNVPNVSLDQIKRVGGSSVGAITALLLSLGYDLNTIASFIDSPDFVKSLLDDGNTYFFNTSSKKNIPISTKLIVLGFMDLYRQINFVNYYDDVVDDKRLTQLKFLGYFAYYFLLSIGIDLLTGIGQRRAFALAESRGLWREVFDYTWEVGLGAFRIKNLFGLILGRRVLTYVVTQFTKSSPTDIRDLICTGAIVFQGDLAVELGQGIITSDVLVQYRDNFCHIIKIAFSLDKASNDSWSLGIFSGDACLAWIKARIAGATGNPDITFADLKVYQDAHRAQGVNMKDLYVTSLNLSTGFTEIFSHEARYHPNAIVADAVRLSMSIPYFFKPHQLKSRTDDAGITVSADLYTDGGVLDNYPIWLFDHSCYLNPNSTYPLSLSNPRTLGFRLVDNTMKNFYEQQEGGITGSGPTYNAELLPYTVALVKAGINQQENIHYHSTDSYRTVYIDTVGIETVDFNLTIGNIKNLIQSGEQGMSDYLKRLSTFQLPPPDDSFGSSPGISGGKPPNDPPPPPDDTGGNDAPDNPNGDQADNQSGKPSGDSSGGSSATSQSSTYYQDPQHWYTDDEVNFLLQHYLSHVANIKILDAMNANQLSGATLASNLQDYQLQSVLQRSVNQETHQVLMIPINLGSYHWVALYVYYGSDNRQQPIIGYFDPYGHNITIDVLKALSSIYIFDQSSLLVSPMRLQEDTYNCGPWMIAILERLVTTGQLPPEHYDINARRQQDTAIFLNHLSGISIAPAYPRTSITDSKHDDTHDAILQPYYAYCRQLRDMTQQIINLCDCPLATFRNNWRMVGIKINRDYKPKATLRNGYAAQHSVLTTINSSLVNLESTTFASIIRELNHPNYAPPKIVKRGRGRCVQHIKVPDERQNTINLDNQRKTILAHLRTLHKQLDTVLKG